MSSGSGSGRAGFGTAQIDPRARLSRLTDQQLLAASGDHTALLQLMQKSLEQLADKYVEPALLQPQIINITGSATAFSQRLDYSNQKHNSVIVSVSAGTFNLFLGDYSGLAQGQVPHVQVPSGTTIQLFFPLLGRVYIVVNPSTTTTLQACIIPAAI